MGNLTIIDNYITTADAVVIASRTGTKIHLKTQKNYVEKDILIPVDVKSGSANTPATTITSNPAISITNNLLVVSHSTSASITPTVTAGWVSAGTKNTVTASGSTTTSSLSIPKANSFTIKMVNNTTADSSALTVNNGNYRKVIVDNGSATNSTITVKAKEQTSDTSTVSHDVVTNGVWNKGTISITSVNTGMSTYFSAGSATSNNVTITPKYKVNDAGYIEEPVSFDNNNGKGETYWNIKTISPAFKATPTGGSTASFSNITTTSTDNGIAIQTKYTINSVTIYYTATGSGWLNVSTTKTSSTTTKKTATDGTAYYITGITIPSTATLTVTGNGTASFKSGGTTSGILNINAYNDASTPALTGNIKLVNNGKWVYGSLVLTSSVTATTPTVARTATTANGATNVGSGNATTTAPSSGYFVSVQAQAPATTITPTSTFTAGYFDSVNRISSTIGTTTKSSNVYYITVPSANPTFSGGAPSGTATIATWTNATSATTNTSGVKLVTGGKTKRAKVTYAAAVNGYVVKSNGADAYAASGEVNLSTNTYYLTGVNIGNSKEFNITIPNGSTTMTLNFKVDSNGNVLVT